MHRRNCRQPASTIHFGARLGIREEAGSQADLHVAEQGAHHRFERALQVTERDSLADHEPFELLEHRRVAQVEVVAPIDAAGDDDADRRLEGLHVADLHRRGVRAKQRGGADLRVGYVAAMRAPRPAGDRRVEVQRVLHVARGMIRRHIERFEVVEVVLDLGALEDLVAHVREDVLDVAPHAHQGMDASHRQRPAWQRDVDRASGERAPRRRERRARFSSSAASMHSVLSAFTEPAGRTRGGASGRQRAELSSSAR